MAGMVLQPDQIRAQSFIRNGPLPSTGSSGCASTCNSWLNGTVASRAVQRNRQTMGVGDIDTADAGKEGAEGNRVPEQQ